MILHLETFKKTLLKRQIDLLAGDFFQDALLGLRNNDSIVQEIESFTKGMIKNIDDVCEGIVIINRESSIGEFFIAVDETSKQIINRIQVSGVDLSMGLSVSFKDTQSVDYNPIGYRLDRGIDIHLLPVPTGHEVIIYTPSTVDLINTLFKK